MKYILSNRKKIAGIEPVTLALLFMTFLVLAVAALILSGILEKDPNSDNSYNSRKQIIENTCENACENDARQYCCDTHNLNNEKIKCSDERLEISCLLDCTSFQCQ